MRFFCIDYGLKRIGLAKSDEKGRIALPLMTLEAGESFETTLCKIIEILKKDRYEEIIIGLPLLLSGKKGEMASLCEKLKEALEQKVSIPVRLWDERLTTAQAQRSLKELEIKRKKRDKIADPLAATLILQSYLDSR